MDYVLGLSILRKCAEAQDWYAEFLVYEHRLQENLYNEKLYGSSEQSRVDRAKIIDQLNRLAYRQCGTNFNDLCRGQNYQPPSVSMPHATTAGIDATHMDHGDKTIQAPAAQGNSLQSQRSRVFISYSPEDRNYLEEFHSHLAYHARTGEIDFWDDTKIKPGADWREEISLAFQSANVAVLLVSADFLASDFIATQVLPPLLTAAKKGEIKVFSVILRACAFTETELAQFYAVNDPLTPLGEMSKGKRAALWTKVVDLVRNSFPKG